MTRTEHANLSHDGRDVELLAQQERAEQFNASTILPEWPTEQEIAEHAAECIAHEFSTHPDIPECAYCGNDINPAPEDWLSDCPARGGAACVPTFAHDDLNHESALTPKEN